MSAVHCVVVWEWQRGGAWLPHAPGVARTLERAHGKRLTRVVLADADPALRGHYVNLRTLTQIADTPDGGTVECRVRRACYSVTSAGGRGARWEWARLGAGQGAAELLFEPLPMRVQCALEDARAQAAPGARHDGWLFCLASMTARGPGGALRLLRRATQPPYPLARSPLAAPGPPPRSPDRPPAPPTPPARAPADCRRPRIPQQHTGSSVHSVQSVQSLRSVRSAPASAAALPPPRAGARSASPKERKPGLARQILHNLNIFGGGHKSTSADRARAEAPSAGEGESAAGGEEARADTDGSSTRSARRHSVDTVSTYLSHESKDSLQRGSVGELLNCSAGSDDVFDAPPPPQPDAEEDEWGWARPWVCAAPQPQWGALCWACVRALSPPLGRALALRRCQHMLHAHCLRDMLRLQQQQQKEPQIECLVCGLVYGPAGVSEGGAQPPEPEPEPLLQGGEQPAGSMAWSVQPSSLPTHPGVGTILVTYNFQSGRQGPGHPAPGAAYYAVGFPRHSVLPDTPLGRQVLSALRAAWERRRLFLVSASQTTGREHVVAWRVGPPPAAAHVYAQLARGAGGGGGEGADTALRAALARLHALLHHAGLPL